VHIVAAQPLNEVQFQCTIMKCNFHDCQVEAAFGFYAQVTDHAERREPSG
jgi:hypothetical protein